VPVPGKLFQPVEAESLQAAATLTNIRLGWKSLPGTDTHGYYDVEVNKLERWSLMSLSSLVYYLQIRPGAESALKVLHLVGYNLTHKY
jgi:hypothetical protein